MSEKANTKSLSEQGRIESKPAAVAEVATANVPATQERARKIMSKLFKDIAVGKEFGVKIAGLIRGTKEKPSTLDNSKTYTEFSGDFRLLMGTHVTVSNGMILPSYPESVIREAFLSAFNNAQPGVNPEVTFAVLVYKKTDPSPKNARGFTWEIDELRPLAQVSLKNDPLLALMG